MTRLAAGGRAAQPGLLCACWFRSRARANHDELTGTPWDRIHRETLALWSATTPQDASGGAGKLTTKGPGQNSASVAHSNAETAPDPSLAPETANPSL